MQIFLNPLGLLKSWNYLRPQLTVAFKQNIYHLINRIPIWDFDFTKETPYLALTGKLWFLHFVRGDCYHGMHAGIILGINLANDRESPTDDVESMCIFPFIAPILWSLLCEKEKKSDNFMCLLEFECANRLKAHRQAIPANEGCYIVTLSLIGWAHTQNDPCAHFMDWLHLLNGLWN